VAEPLVTTTYTVTVTAANGCTDTDEVTVTVDKDAPTANIKGTTEICSGDQSILDASSSIVQGTPSYVWEKDGITLPNEIGDTLIVRESGEYVLEITDSNGCTDTDTLVVKVNIVPSIEPIEDVEECDSYELPQLPDGFGYYAQTMGVEPVSGTITNDAILYVYAATGTENMCWVEDTFNVTISITPEVGEFDDVDVCDSYTLPELEVGKYYTAAQGEGDLLEAGTVINSTQTIYVYAESESGLCSEEESFLVTINESPNAVTTQISPAECGIPNSGTATVTVISGGSGSYSYLWENGSTTKTVTNLSPGVHSVVVTDIATGCSDNATVLITEDDTQAPEIICPENIDTIITSETCEIELNIPAPEVTDNCSVGTLINNFNNSADASGNYPASTTIVQWIATDNAGNADTCYQTITVKSAPVANNDIVTLSQNTQNEIVPLANDFDCDNNIDTTTFEIVIQPVNGTISEIDTERGTFIYTPEDGFTGTDSIQYKICDTDNLCDEAWVLLNVNSVNEPPVAVNDTVIVGNCAGEITINVTANDYDPDGDILTTPELIASVENGTLTQNEDGTFTYNPVDGFEGTVQFTYEICDSENQDAALCDQAVVTITVMLDTDCDNVPDEIDIDDDNDGILDIDETFTADTDSDGIPNYLDIDSDNDGIIDNIEGQAEGTHREPVWNDSDGDGWDDQYDPDSGGTYFDLADTDTDGDPDFIDSDADDDGVDDYIEGFDLVDGNGVIDSIPETYPAGTDADLDGLDDNYDNIYGWNIYNNPTGGNAPLPDYDNDGIRAWRDADDKPEGGGGNPVVGCELIVPNGFSPNNDGANDFFKVVFECEEGEQTFGEIYPNAKLYVYNRWGNLLYEKEHFGNTGILGTTDAWWDGYSENTLTVGNKKVPTGTYIYILVLDGNDVRKGTVFVNY
jgi:gliding motility-associated-like protein